MSSNYLRGMRKKHRFKMTKGLGLVCLLFMVSMVAVACSRSTKEYISENDKIEDTRNQLSDLPVADPTPIKEPETTAEPTPTKEPTPTSEPASNSDFIPSEEVFHSTVAFIQGNYLFYKTGKLTETVIASKDLKTSKVTELAAIEDSYFSSSEFYLKGSNIYYHAEGDIYRIGVDGKNKNRLFKGTVTILGFQDDDIFALDRKAREIIRINKKGEKKSLVKLNSIDSLEAVMVHDGLYYISKSSNNTLEGNDPIDRLYYIDFDGKNKIEIYTGLDIFDLKLNENELYFLAIAKEPEAMMLNKVKKQKVTTIHSSSKQELEAQGCNWFEANTFTLLAANATHVYYGVDFNNGMTMNVYSVGTDGENHGLYLNAFDIEGMNGSAYFMRGDMDGGYLKILFDCDEDPVEIYLIDLQDKSTIKFEGGYFISSSIDVVEEYVYYCKSSQYDRYGEMPEAYEYGRSKISTLK
ncbi:MAG: DUF5050 domain-containing protein, partial [Mobilitalea sp.]